LLKRGGALLPVHRRKAGVRLERPAGGCPGCLYRVEPRTGGITRCSLFCRARKRGILDHLAILPNLTERPGDDPRQSPRCRDLAPVPSHSEASHAPARRQVKSSPHAQAGRSRARAAQTRARARAAAARLPQGDRLLHRLAEHVEEIRPYVAMDWVDVSVGSHVHDRHLQQHRYEHEQTKFRTLPGLFRSQIRIDLAAPVNRGNTHLGI
jgi:hypothetical protein